MVTFEGLRDMRSLDYVLGQANHDSRMAPLPPVKGEVTGYAEMDLKTGEIKCYYGRRPADSEARK